jgi:hypothetical protein
MHICNETAVREQLTIFPSEDPLDQVLYLFQRHFERKFIAFDVNLPKTIGQKAYKLKV